jgi:hypothetical protein
MIDVSTAAELSQIAPATDHPTPAEVAELREWLTAELMAATAGWERPGGMLGITKGRVLAAMRCPASVLAELEPWVMNEAMAIGTIADAAASLLLMSDKLPGRAPWLGAIMPALQASSTEVTEFVERLTPEARADLRDVVQLKCEQLDVLLGDLRACDGTAQEWFRVQLHEPGVQLSGRTDLVLGRGHRSIVEVKSGRFMSHIHDELRFYALLAALRDPSAPVTVAAVTLGDAKVSAYPVTCDLLEAAAQRVIDATAVLVEVDRATAASTWPTTAPGAFCSWCAVAPRCPDAPDLALAEFEANGYNVDFVDKDKDEPW